MLKLIRDTWDELSPRERWVYALAVAVAVACIVVGNTGCTYRPARSERVTPWPGRIAHNGPGDVHAEWEPCPVETGRIAWESWGGFDG